MSFGLNIDFVDSVYQLEETLYLQIIQYIKN